MPIGGKFTPNAKMIGGKRRISIATPQIGGKFPPHR